MPSFARYIATSAHHSSPGASVASVGDEGDADADAHAHLHVVDVEGLVELGGDPLCDLGRLLGVRVDQHDAELVTAESDSTALWLAPPR